MFSRLVDGLPWLRSQQPLLVLLDVVAVLLAGLPLLGSIKPAPVLVAAVAVVLTCHSTDLYRPRLVLGVLEDLPRLLLAAGLGVLVLVAAAPRLGVADDATWPAVPVFAAMLALLLVLLRATAYALVHTLRRRGHAGHPVVIAGAGEVGSALATTLLEQPHLGLRPVGIVESDTGASARHLPVPLLGGIDKLERAMVDLGVNDVVFAFPAPPDAETVGVVRRCVEKDHQVFVVPRFHELMGVTGSSGVEVVQGVTLMRLRRWGHRPLARFGKRAIDVTVAGIALVAASPVMALCALGSRIETGPGVIFKQTRVGVGGTPFTLYKFRSMKPDDETESATRWNIDQDHRVGPIGRFLRRTSLDELPQLVNVLRGDMSLVGPRPERPYFVDSFSRSDARYADRHRVPTGLTGLSQIHRLRGDTSISERTRVDNFYIENWSLWSDVKILCRTLPVLVRAPRGEAGALRLGPAVPGGPSGTPGGSPGTP